MKKLSNLSKKMIFSLSIIIFSIHFIFTILYVIPISPIKVAAMPAYSWYMNKFFAQIWTLFAPNPIQTNNSVMVKCLDSNKDNPKEQWIDIAEPLWHAHQQKRVSAYDRLSRVITNPMRYYLAGPPETKYLVEACQRGDKNACKQNETDRKTRQQQSIDLMKRPASAYCQDKARALQRQPYKFVALRIKIEAPPSWPERFSNKKISHDLQVGTFPAFEIKPPGIYRFDQLDIINMKAV